MPQSKIEQLIPNLQTSDLLLQHLFMYSRGHLGPHAYLDFVRNSVGHPQRRY